MCLNSILFNMNVFVCDEVLTVCFCYIVDISYCLVIDLAFILNICANFK